MQDRRKRRTLLRIAAAIFVGVLLSGCKGKETVPLQETDTKTVSEETEENSTDTRKEKDTDKEEYTGQEADTVFVYVCGAVVSPGVYELDSGARVYEALEAAGGMKEEAAQEILNQAGKIEDGGRIYVPTKEEAAEGLLENAADSDGVVEGTAGSDNSEQGKINMNTAGLEELKTLSGIGDAKAQSIIRYREENGEFQTIEEVMNVEGIKEGVFNKIKDKITV
ncbi:ComEA family DNA-binding protein [Ruminococcus sp. AF18-22]|nr:ComEA family DNA-binding protein [Ruminococcus sp. AF18-22]